MNSLFIIGNLVRDPETRTMGSGHTVCTFTLAVNRRVRPGEEAKADYFRVSAWDKRGEVCQKYLAKGRKACVTGAVRVDTYQAHDGSTRAVMEVTADSVEFLTPRASEGAPAGETVDKQSGFTAVETDELPF